MQRYYGFRWVHLPPSHYERIDYSHFRQGSVQKTTISVSLDLYLSTFGIWQHTKPERFRFEKEVMGANDVPAYRFTPPKNVFGSVEENPDNLCFCPQGPPCAPSGFFNVSLCQYGKSTKSLNISLELCSIFLF